MSRLLIFSLVGLLIVACQSNPVNSASTIKDYNNKNQLGFVNQQEIEERKSNETLSSRKPSDYGNLMECFTDQVRDAGYFLALAENSQNKFMLKLIEVNGWGSSKEIYFNEVVLDISEDKDCDINISDKSNSSDLRIEAKDGSIWLKQVNQKYIQDKAFSHLSCTISDSDLEKVCKTNT